MTDTPTPHDYNVQHYQHHSVSICLKRWLVNLGLFTFHRYYEECLLKKQNCSAAKNKITVSIPAIDSKAEALLTLVSFCCWDGILGNAEATFLVGARTACWTKGIGGHIQNIIFGQDTVIIISRVIQFHVLAHDRRPMDRDFGARVLTASLRRGLDRWRNWSVFFCSALNGRSSSWDSW